MSKMRVQTWFKMHHSDFVSTFKVTQLESSESGSYPSINHPISLFATNGCTLNSVTRCLTYLDDSQSTSSSYLVNASLGVIPLASQRGKGNRTVSLHLFSDELNCIFDNIPSNSLMEEISIYIKTCMLSKVKSMRWRQNELWTDWDSVTTTACILSNWVLCTDVCLLTVLHPQCVCMCFIGIVSGECTRADSQI